MTPSQTAATAFLELRRAFFDSGCRSIPFHLRPKANTQSDPLDDFISESVFQRLGGFVCIPAPGPLTSPDMVLIPYTDDLLNPTEALAIEVKKVTRTRRRAARHAGMDYNSTPPAGHVRVYTYEGREIMIPAYYLVVCQEPVPEAATVQLTGLVLIEGFGLDADDALYAEITGPRSKRIGLGSYGDGMDRTRPMLVFSNPLGVPQFDHVPTLVVSDPDLQRQVPAVRLVFEVHRTLKPSNDTRVFFAYRAAQDVPSEWDVETLVDPFPVPVKRDTKTRPRGMFRLPASLDR